MANKLLSIVIFSIPNSYCPIIRASNEYRAFDWIPIRITSNSIDRTSMTIISSQILLRVRNWTSVNCTVLSSSEIVHTIFALREIYTQTTCINESHTAFLVSFHSSKNILLIGIGFSLKLHYLCIFKTLFHWPFNDSSISRSRDESLTFSFSFNPLNFPNNISMLALKVFTLSNWLVICVFYIVNSNITMRVSYGN